MGVELVLAEEATVRSIRLVIGTLYFFSLDHAVIQRKPLGQGDRAA